MGPYRKPRWTTPWQLQLALLAFACAAVSGCGMFAASVSTPDQWYPNYSKFRVAEDKPIIVYVHGYGGSEETFRVVPYLQASLDPERRTTVMYFNYDTGALRANLSSIGQVAGDLMVFLEHHVFSLREPNPHAEKRKPFLNVICHSTGCPIVRQYIANNLSNHGVAKVLAVAGANYGAYYAESASQLKAKISFLHGDKQVNELRYGSSTLATLQERYHFLTINCDFVPEDDPNKWNGDRLRQCKHRNTSALYDTAFHSFGCGPDRKGKERNPYSDYCRGGIYLPRIISVIGTDGWTSSGSKKFSDTVVRFESALIDCRVLKPVEPEEMEVFGIGELDAPCNDKAIVVLPCRHTEFFSAPKCSHAVISLVDYFLIDVDSNKFVASIDDRKDKQEEIHRIALGIEGSYRKRLADTAPDCLNPSNPRLPKLKGAELELSNYERDWKRFVFECQYKVSQENKLKEFIESINVGALWVKVIYDGLPGAGDPADKAEYKNAIMRIKLKISLDAAGTQAVEYDAPLPFHLIESDFRGATRTSELRPERSFYFKYLKAGSGGTPTEVYLHISIQDDPTQYKTRMLSVTKGDRGQPEKFGYPDSPASVNIHRGQSTIVYCRHHSGGFDCINVTDNPPIHGGNLVTD